MAYAGLRWHWSPRVWDPQAARSNLQVKFSSPSLPPWLSWDEKGTLSGTPPQDAQSCDVTVEARVSLFSLGPRSVFLRRLCSLIIKTPDVFSSTRTAEKKS